MFKNDNFVDADYSKNNFMSYEDIYSHKYAISHYMRWDTIYLLLKSDFIIFMYNGFNYYLWYDLFLKDNEN